MKIVTAAIHNLVKCVSLWKAMFFNVNFTIQMLDESFDIEHNNHVSIETYVATHRSLATESPDDSP